jgi:hypothetical protein
MMRPGGIGWRVCRGDRGQHLLSVRAIPLAVEFSSGVDALVVRF